MVLGNRVHIAHVNEIKFTPIEYYGYRHCAFLVLLASGAEYIFDPTGVQFGPQWPLICPRREYEQRFMDPNHEKRNYRQRELGENCVLRFLGKFDTF